MKIKNILCILLTLTLPILMGCQMLKNRKPQSAGFRGYCSNCLLENMDKDIEQLKKVMHKTAVSTNQNKRNTFLNQSKATILSKLSPDEKKTLSTWRKEYSQDPKSFQEKFQTISFFVFYTDSWMHNFNVHQLIDKLNSLLVATSNRAVDDTQPLKKTLKFLSSLTDAEKATVDQWRRENEEQGQKSVLRKVYFILEEAQFGTKNVL